MTPRSPKAIANIAETNNITLLQLRETLEADGIRFPLFREQLREDILINRLKQKEVINRIVITEQDIKNFLAREMGSSRQRTAVRLLHILIATPEGASPQDVQAAKKRAMEIHQELLEGGDFSELAIRHSMVARPWRGVIWAGLRPQEYPACSPVWWMRWRRTLSVPRSATPLASISSNWPK